MTVAALDATPPTQYARNGFVVFRGQFTPAEIREAGEEANAVRERYKHLISTRNLRCRWSDNVLTGECQFDAFDPIIDLSPACRRTRVPATMATQLRAANGSFVVFDHPAGQAKHTADCGT
jgi:hypothetical protein